MTEVYGRGDIAAGRSVGVHELALVDFCWINWYILSITVVALWKFSNFVAASFLRPAVKLTDVICLYPTLLSTPHFYICTV